MAKKPTNTSRVIYHPPRSRYAKTPTSSVVPLGIDTEAYNDGKLMMVCTSEGDIWRPEDWLTGLLSRKYRQKTFVAYNLRYDSGAFLQHLPKECLEELRVKGKTQHDATSYSIIANKMIRISRHNNPVTIYDIKQYYEGSLDHNAEKYLGDKKIEQATKSYSYEYVEDNWDDIAKYCVHDAELTAQLAQRLIAQLNSWGLHVSKLYSTAWISYQWFAAKCGHPTVDHFMKYDRAVLDFAMQSYNGGKFEVTKKGAAHLYEYDLVSAYPATIANLLDLHDVKVKWSTRYIKDAPYAFMRVVGTIPINLPSPVALQVNGLNLYPAGVINRVITKVEYDYLIRNGADITITEACWLTPETEQYMYREEIEHLVQLKQQYKGKDDLAYHTVKILMNSLYGKFVQLIEQGNGFWRAGSSWNPIYASIITADTRVRISDLQRQYPSIWAVHTDSIISDQPLPFPKSSSLGALSYEIDGPGIVVGCGVYEIADKCAIRGVPSAVRLSQLATYQGRTADVSSVQPVSWRKALLSTYGRDIINQWRQQLKRLDCAMDTKRIWLDDWTSWDQVTTRQVLSVPRVNW